VTGLAHVHMHLDVERCAARRGTSTSIGADGMHISFSGIDYIVEV
jgi:hypothetical protein